jgi:membrane protease YdiL (CAAX protease family)
MNRCHLSLQTIVFLAIAFGGAWALEIGLRATWPLVARGALAMLMPAVAAWLVRGPLFHLGYADAGLAPRFAMAWRVYVLAYLAIPAIVLTGFFISVASGLQHFGIQSVPQILAAFGAPHQTLRGHGELGAITVMVVAACALTVFIPTNMLFTFGEEFGWRGFLLVQLAPRGRVRAAVLVGVLWGLWHAPVIVLDNYVYPGQPLIGILLMVVFTTSMSIVFAWLRFASGSIWPAVLAHAAFNTQSTLAYLVLSPANSLLRPPAGLCTIIPAASVALWIVLTGRLSDPSFRAATVGGCA